MADIAPASNAFSPATAQVLISNLQTQIVARSRTISPAVVGRSAGSRPQLSKLFALRTMFSVVPRQERSLAMILESQSKGSFIAQTPRAAARPVLDPVTVQLPSDTWRKVLIMVRFATEVVVLRAVRDVLMQGRDVLVSVQGWNGNWPQVGPLSSGRSRRRVPSPRHSSPSPRSKCSVT